MKMKMIFCVPAQNVETMDTHRGRLMEKKASDKQNWREEQQDRESFKHRPTGKHLVNDYATKSLLRKLKKRGGSRKPRKTKKRRRNSKKIYKAKNLI